MTLEKKPFDNILGKEGNASNQHFLLFPRCFLPNQQHQSSFELHLKCHNYANAFKLDWSQILSFGKEFTDFIPGQKKKKTLHD